MAIKQNKTIILTNYSGVKNIFLVLSGTLPATISPGKVTISHTGKNNLPFFRFLNNKQRTMFGFSINFSDVLTNDAKGEQLNSAQE